MFFFILNIKITTLSKKYIKNKKRKRFNIDFLVKCDTIFYSGITKIKHVHSGGVNMEFVKRGATEYSIEEIKAKIINEKLKPHDKLPSERAWCETLGVSKSSIRRAIEHLEGEGVVYTVPNQGIFVKESKIQIDLTYFTSFSNQMKNKQLDYSTYIIECRIIQATRKLSKKLKIKEDDEILELSRCRIVKEEPFSIQKAFIPLKDYPKLDEYDFSKYSLYDVLEKYYNTKVCQGKEELHLTYPNELEASYLNVSKSKFVLYCEVVNYDKKGKPVEYLKQIIDPDKVGYFAESSDLGGDSHE